MAITLTATAAAVVAGRVANHFGIGEVINLTATIAPAPVLTIWNWTVTSGADRAHFSHNGNQARIIVFGLSGGTISVRVKNMGDNQETTLNLTIVAPTVWSLGPRYHDYHVTGFAHSAFRAVVQVQNNNNVSFDNLEMREGNAIPIRTGRYVTANVNANNHHGATFPLSANWLRIGTQRAIAALQAHASPGNIAIGSDQVGSHQWGPPFNEDGTFTWRIPWTYRLSIPVGSRVDIRGAAVTVPDAGNRQANNVVEHVETLVGSQMTMTKGGQTATYTAAQASVGTLVQWQTP